MSFSADLQNTQNGGGNNNNGGGQWSPSPTWSPSPSDIWYGNNSPYGPYPNTNNQVSA